LKFNLTRIEVEYLETKTPPSELYQLIKNYLESKVGSALDDFTIEGQMSPDATGDVGVTGSYKIRNEARKYFFTITVNLTSHKIQNLQQY
jgi:hypothetical protein